MGVSPFRNSLQIKVPRQKDLTALYKVRKTFFFVIAKHMNSKAGSNLRPVLFACVARRFLFSSFRSTTLPNFTERDALKKRQMISRDRRDIYNKKI